MPVKSIEKRIREATEMYVKLADVGLDSDDDDVRKLRRIVAEYVRDGVGWSGKVPIRSVGRVAHVKLSTQDHVDSVVFLRVG